MDCSEGLRNHSVPEDEESDEGDLLLPKHPPAPLAIHDSPEDSYNMVYIIFLLMGIGSMLPWNFFITARNYWIYKLSNTSDHSGHEEPHSDLSDYFESDLAICSMVPSILCVILNYVLVNRLSPKVRNLSYLIMILLVFVVTTVLVKVDVSNHRVEFFTGTLASVVLITGASNAFGSSMFGICGHFPMRITQAFSLGLGMAGTVSALASILDLAVADDVTTSALVYFLMADIFIVVCIIMYLLLPGLAYSRHYMSAVTSANPGVMTEGGRAVSSIIDQLKLIIYQLKLIMKEIWVLALSVFYVFCVTLTVFPAVSSGIVSVHMETGIPLTTTYFVPVTSFFFYNIADLCGRLCTIWLQVPGPTSRVLPVLVLCRTVLIPLFMFCNFQPRDHLHTVVFNSDIYPIVFNCLLGLSNGYLGTLLMIYGPKVGPRELAEATGVVMSFWLILGLAVGSGFSSLIVQRI